MDPQMRLRLIVLGVLLVVALLAFGLLASWDVSSEIDPMEHCGTYRPCD